MQLKGLVRFFAIALILICIYQLSFTWFVHSHESSMDARADNWVSRNYLSPQAKYPSSAESRALYADTLKQVKDSVTKHYLDSTKDSKIGLFSLVTYRSAKDKELMLGLDLQGGMSVTLAVGLDELIRSLSNYSKDPFFVKALDSAVARKATSGADLISLFTTEYKRINPSGALAPIFAARSNSKIKFTSSDAAVTSYLQDQANEAFKNTLRIMRTRIDGFGLSSPNINSDPAKAIISVELAGVTDHERVRNYLQSTANLQFFDVYTIDQVYTSFQAADKAVQDYLNGIKDTSGAKDSTGKTITAAKSPGTASSTAKTDTAGKSKTNEAPIARLIQTIPPSKDKNGNVVYSGALGFVPIKDTGLLNRYLKMDIARSKFPANAKFLYGKVDQEDPKSRNAVAFYVIKTLDNGQAELEGDHVSDAKQDFDEQGRVDIRMAMDPVGTNLWGRMTTRNVKRPVAIVLDNVVYSAPNVVDPITTGNTSITGSYTVKEAQDLSEILMSGKLPAPAKIVQEQIVGPTLGKAAVHGGALAFGISFLVIFLLMLLYYNTGGWVANIALILNLLFTIGVLSAMGFTLTAPGIAGLVLTVGMAVDTNVIIFERIKEELTRGKSYQIAVNDGYRRSLAPVLDAHVTTLLTAIILASFGLGPVLGFATTQIIGILLSLFCGILVSRLITDWYTNKNRHFEYFTGISRKVFKHAAYKFIEYRKIAYGISVVVLLMGLYAIFFNGFNEGVEFKGGRSYTIRFDKAVAQNQDAIADDLKKQFDGEAPVIKTVDNADQLNITTAYLINKNGKNVDSTVETHLYQGLKNYLPQDLSYAEFATKYFQGSQTVQPSISDDLKNGAKEATIFALIIICLYIFIRFRDWRYSLGTIVSLLHDVFVTLIVFSFFKNIVPFPLEIDQHFIAAILTVIGFSMNDTVIVYDRIRENSRLMKGATNAAIINKSVNDTLSRTVMTSLTVFLTILILFIFGGEVTRGFAFAMLVGVITGTYSSIFVAAPILVDFAKTKALGSGEDRKKRLQ